MPEELNLDEIRLKESSELSDEEGKFLKENVKELTDEEKEDYKDILGVEKEGKEKEGEGEAVTFKDQGAFDTAVDKRVGELKAEAAKKKEEKRGEAKGDRLFSEGYKPKDWDEFGKTMLGIVRKDREIFTKQQRQKMTEVDKQLDAETEDLRKIDPSIPSNRSKKRREFDRALAEIMIKDPKITTITKAYGVYKEGQSDADKKKQEELAKKIGGGGGTGEKGKKDKVLHRDLDDAEAAAVRRFKALS
jgi:hypothetical protein